MLAQDLCRPAARVPLDALADHWRLARLEACIPGHGVLARNFVLMNRIRGAFGRRLMEGASREALAGQPCPWRPPCTLDVLFREQARVGKHGLPKPFTLSLDRHGRDLLVRLALLGFAMDWAAAAAQALVAALRHDIDWRGHADGNFLPRPEVESFAIAEAGIPGLAREATVLRFVTPLDASGDDPLDRPATIIGRLARRVDLMSRWMGVEVDADWPLLARLWNGLDYHSAGLRRAAGLPRRSGRNGNSFSQALVEGELSIAGPLDPIRPILVVGQSCHAGRGATHGLGRYVLE